MADSRSIRVACAAALFLGALAIGGQTLPATGNIFGTVVDAQGAPLPGVEARLLGAGERQPVQTDARGTFRFLYISPGTYALALSLDGFATVNYEQVVVAIDRSTPLRAVMELASVSENVTVTDATPSIDPRKTVTGATFGVKELQQIPSARNVWATLWASPGVVSNQVNVGGNTAVQASPVSKGTEGATYNLAGSDITLGGISPTFYNFDSFQEIQVITGGSDVTLLNGGTTFNMVTRRGTNAIHGSGRYFYAPDRWEAHNTPPDVFVDTLSTNRTNVLRDYGLEAGGPLVSDRLWVWGAWGTNQIDLQKLGPPDPNGQTIDENSTLVNFDARLDAQIAASNSVELYYHHGDRSAARARRQPGRRAGGRVRSESAGPDLQGGGHAGVLSQPDRLGILFLHGFHGDRDSGGGLDADVYLDPDFVQRGSTSFAQNLAIVRQVGASASKFFTTGKFSHEIKVGFGYRSTTSDSTQIWPGNQVLGGRSRGARDRHAQRRLQHAAAADLGFRERHPDERPPDGQPSACATTTGGRATFPRSCRPTRRTRTCFRPFGTAGTRGTPSRRAAGSRAWARRTRSARAAERSSAVPIRALRTCFSTECPRRARFHRSRAFTTDGATRTRTTASTRAKWTSTTSKAGSTSIPSTRAPPTAPNQISPGLKPTTIDEAVFGVDQELFGGIAASAHYTYRSIHGIVFNPYIGVTPGGGGYEYFGNASGAVTDPNGFGIAFDVPYFGVTLDPPPTGTVLENRPAYSQTYQGVSLQLVKALSDRWLFRGTFSWNSWKQSVTPQSIFDPNEVVGGPNRNGGQVAGRTGVASAWTFSLSGLYQLPLGLAVSGAFAGRQGFPLQYFVLVAPNDAIGNRIAILTSPVGSYRLPDVYEVDLRLQETFSVGPVSVTPSFNVYNAANANTVLARRTQTGTYNAAREVAFRPDARFNAIEDFQSPRIFQVGLQVAF